MKTYEYSVLKLKNSFTTSTKIDQLSTVGEDGWELVSVVQHEDYQECFLKRETDSVAEQAKEKLDDALDAIKNVVGGAGQAFAGGFPQR